MAVPGIYNAALIKWECNKKSEKAKWIDIPKCVCVFFLLPYEEGSAKTEK